MSDTNLLVEFKHPAIEEVQTIWPLVGNALSFESRKWWVSGSSGRFLTLNYSNHELPRSLASKQ